MDRHRSGASAQIRKYFASLPPAARTHLRALRDAIRSAAPDATETFGYGMPGFRLNGSALVWYAAWKEHSSMYPISASIRRKHIGAASGAGKTKDTVRFPIDTPPPASLIKKLVTARIAELSARTKQ